MHNLNLKSPMVWAIAGLALWMYHRHMSCDCKK
jgi:hypothetical protein